MPIPAAEQFTPEFARLLDLVAGNLFYIAKEVKTREEAIVIKEKFQKPLGIINARFNLTPNGNKRKGVDRHTGRE